MWGNLRAEDSSQNIETGETREKDLVAKKDWWDAMISRDNKIWRHDGHAASALNIVDNFFALRDSKSTIILNIQKELVNLQLNLEDTDAEREMQKKLHKMRESYQAQISELKDSYQTAMADKDQQLAEHLLLQRKSLDEKLETSDRVREELKVSLERLAQKKTAKYDQLLLRVQRERKQQAQTLTEYEKTLKELQAQQQIINEKHRADQARYEQIIRDLEQQSMKMMKKQDDQTVKRLQEEKKRNEVKREAMKQRFHREHDEQRRKIEVLQVDITDQKMKRRKRDYVLPLLNILAGAGTTVAGVLLLQPGMVSSGVGMIGGAFNSDGGGGA